MFVKIVRALGTVAIVAALAGAAVAQHAMQDYNGREGGGGLHPAASEGGSHTAGEGGAHTHSFGTL